MAAEHVVSDLDVAAQYAELEIRSVVEQFASAHVTPVATIAAASASAAAEESSDDMEDENEDAVVTTTTNTITSSSPSSTSSDEDDDEGDDDDDEASRAALRAEIEMAMAKEESRAAAEPLKTANEVAAVPVREPSVELTRDCPIARCGTVLSASVPGLMLTIKSDANAQPLDEESVLCLEDRTVIGCVDEVFGPVMMPMYLVRFESAEKMPARATVVGTVVYYATEHTTYIVPADIQDKGTDASNIFDEETDETVYSDDEAESAAKRQHRKRTRGGNAAEPGPSRVASASSQYVMTGGGASSSRESRSGSSSSSYSEYRHTTPSSDASSGQGGGRGESRGGGGIGHGGGGGGRGVVPTSDRTNYTPSGPAPVQFQTQSHGGQTNYTSQPGFIVPNSHAGYAHAPLPMGYAQPPPMGYAQAPLMPYGQVPMHQPPPPHPFAPQFHPQQPQMTAYPPPMPRQPFYHQPAPPPPYHAAPQFAPQSTAYYHQQQHPQQHPQQQHPQQQQHQQQHPQQLPPPPLPPGSYEPRR